MPDASDPREDVGEITSLEGIGEGEHDTEIKLTLLSYWEKKKVEHNNLQ